MAKRSMRVYGVLGGALIGVIIGGVFALVVIVVNTFAK